jgi:PAS domain S-box-containing protein
LDQLIHILNVLNFFFLALALLGMYYYAFRLRNELKRSDYLRKEAQRYQELFNATWDGVFQTDRKGRILLINRSGALTLGYRDTEELVASRVSAQFFFPEREVARGLVRGLLKGSLIRNHVVRIKRLDGELIFAEITVNIRETDEGELLGYEGIFRDVTERVAMDQELNKYRHHLEELVEERTTLLESTNRQLEQEIVERKEADRKIKASLKEKEVLLHEVHHRVKNNLQVISSLLGLQSGQIEDPVYQEAFKESQNRIRSIALVHEKLYSTQDFARVEFNRYLQSLAHDLVRSYGADVERVELDVRVKDVFLAIDQAIPCGLIVNELVSNALKHAFPQPREKGAGRVRIKMRPLKAGRVELTVTDNGIGMPADVNVDETESLGLRLVSILARDQLRGTLDVKVDGGTRFKVTFPTSEQSGNKDADSSARSADKTVKKKAKRGSRKS